MATPVKNIYAGVVRYRRVRPPADYLFRIESFSRLRRSLCLGNKNAFESSEFVAHGYTWVLRIHPNDTLSIYIKMVRTPDDANSMITCSFKFFIYDHKHDNFLVFQNMHEKNFHALKNEDGISTKLNLNRLSPEYEGCLKNGCCIFGVEISVTNTATTSNSSMMLNKLTSPCSYTWKIDKFSQHFDKQYLTSPTFTLGNYSWTLRFYPKGTENQHGNWLSLYMYLDDHAQIATGHKLLIEYKTYVKDQRKVFNTKDIELTGCRWFDQSTHEWGFPNFLKLEELHKYLRNDCLIAEVTLNSIFELSDSKPGSLSSLEKMPTNHS